MDAFKSGFEEHLPTGSENLAPGISFDFEQGLFSQTPSKHTLSDIRGHKPTQYQLPRKRPEVTDGRGPHREDSRSSLTVKPNSQ